MPRHTATDTNKKANLSAKKVATTLFVEPERFCEIGMGTYKGELKDTKDNLRATTWENLPGRRHSKEFLGNFNKQRARTMTALSRNKLLGWFSHRALLAWGPLHKYRFKTQ